MLKKKIIVFAALTVLVIGLLTYQSLRGEGRFIDFPTYPLRLIERGTSWLVNSVQNFVNTYLLIAGKEEENRRLLSTIREYENQLNRWREAGQENERLRKILQLKATRPDYVASAEVYARDPMNWFQMLWINKGLKDGIARDMVVVTPAGPVGRVHRVFDEGANVILITDVNSSIAVRLQSSRADGILEGSGDNRCILKYIPKEIDIKAGERVITSGLDGIYPEGLLIGYVSDMDSERVEIFQQVEVMPAQDLNAVEEVAILKR